MDLRKIKQTLRHDMREKRRQAQQESPQAAMALADVFLNDVHLATDAVIGGYYPLPDEMDPLPLMLALAEKGHRLCLPVVVAPRTSLVFRAYQAGDHLHAGALNVQEPTEAQEKRIPDILLMPLLAFDRFGQRLGYGGGFYDRTLNELRQTKAVRAIGIAYAAQEVASVPTGHYDRPLDAIVTERELVVPNP